MLRRPVVWLPISLVLLGLVAWRSHVWEATELLGSPAPLPLAVAVLLNGLVVGLWAIRSANLLGAAGHPVARTALLPMTAFANTINNLTPGSAGEVVRAWLLRARHAVPYAAGTAVIVIERVVALAYMGASALVRMDTTIAGLLTDPRHLVGFAVTTALIFATYTAQLWLVAASLGVTLDPLATWGALGLATVAGILSLLPFGLGATDAVLATLLVSMGVPASAAGAITFGYRLVATLPLGLIGAASYGWLSARLPPGGTSAVIEAVTAGIDERPEVAG